VSTVTVTVDTRPIVSIFVVMVWDDVEEGQIHLVKDPLTGSYFPRVEELPKNDHKAKEVLSETVQLSGKCSPTLSQSHDCSQGTPLDRTMRTKSFSSVFKGNKRARLQQAQTQLF
jgi:hypothetical protein